MKRFDVIVLGGGPAGTATAMALLKHGYSVLVIERSHYEDWRVGETLPPHVCMPLAALGVWDHFLHDGHLSSPATYAAWGSAELYPTHFIFNPYGPGWHLDRRRFNALLARSAEAAGARLLQDTRVVTASYTDPHWHLRINAEGQQGELEASFLVDATGRSGWLARSLARKRIIYDDMLALVRVLKPQRSATSTDCSPVLYLEATENGWWYSAPVPDGALVIAHITDRDHLTTSGLSPVLFWADRLGRTEHTLARSRSFQIDGEVHVKSASTYILERPAGPGWLAVGDAACTYDPLAAEGITKALRSSLRAAETIHAALQGDAEAPNNYVIELASEFGDYLIQRVQYYRRETRWPASLFWRRRFADED